MVNTQGNVLCGRSLTLLIVAMVGVIGLASRSVQATGIIEYLVPMMTAEPFIIITGPDGNLWFTEPGANKIGKITPAGIITEFNANGPAWAITGGTDGNLWFTKGDKIGQMSPAGTVLNEFPIPLNPLCVCSIINGPDGNLWFTEYSRNMIARITTAGTITETSIPTSNSGPYDITVGPDNALWFTEGIGSKIGRITTAGVITAEFVTPGLSPRRIISGPDGALWFTDYGGNKIGRITTAGIVTSYPTPTAISGPEFIVTGSDGNLWFTENKAQQVGKISPAGIITEYPTSTIGPIGITNGPDGKFWITEAGAPAKIGTFATTLPVTLQSFSVD